MRTSKETLKINSVKEKLGSHRIRKFDTFHLITYPAVIIVFILFVWMLLVYLTNSIPAFQREGLDVYLKNIWNANENPLKEYYGVLAAIWGSIYTSLIALAVALPLSLSYSIFVVDYAPRKLKNILIITSDIMAGLPTIIYGLWGAFFLVPFLKDWVMMPLYQYFSFIPLFSQKPVSGFSFLSAGILLGIMITPFVSGVVREAYKMVPFTYREAAYSLGLTRYESTKLLIGYIKPATYSGVILGFGRAIGETVAVSLVVGNSFNLTANLFAPGYTISSLIANQFGNSFIYSHMTAVLYAAGLFLFIIGLVINLLGIYILRRWKKNVSL